MRKFLAGLAVGLTIGLAGSVSAASLVGKSGYLMGWTVNSGEGEEICDSPFIWTATKEIECD